MNYPELNQYYEFSNYHEYLYLQEYVAEARRLQSSDEQNTVYNEPEYDQQHRYFT